MASSSLLHLSSPPVGPTFRSRSLIPSSSSSLTLKAAAFSKIKNPFAATKNQEPTIAFAAAPEGVAAAAFDFNKYMTEKAAEVNLSLSLAVPPDHPEPLRSAIRYSLLAGGKRIRPVLCLAAASLLSSSETLALPAACSLEMIHTMSLIHDDLPCMDNDSLRRGIPTCHVTFSQPTAVLAGDSLLSLAFLHLSTATAAPPHLILRSLAELARSSGSRGLVAGQIVDMESVRKFKPKRSITHTHTQDTRFNVVHPNLDYVHRQAAEDEVGRGGVGSGEGVEGEEEEGVSGEAGSELG